MKGGGTATGVGDDTYKPHNVTLETSESYSYTWTDGKLTVPQNYGSENYIAIPVKGVNGELTITVANSSSKTQFKYSVVLGSSTTSPGSGTATTKAAPSTTTVTGLAASNYVVYIGRTGDSYKNEFTVDIPNEWIADNLNVVAFISRPLGNALTDIYVTNANKRKLGEFDEATDVRGDADGDGEVTISDVTTLIDCLLAGQDAPSAGGDANMDGMLSIDDVTTLIDYLLTGNWID